MSQNCTGTEMHNCALCGAHSTMMCQRCFENYCSISCQINDWSKHKLICVPMPMLIPIGNFPKTRSVASRLERSAEFTATPLRRPHVAEHNITNRGSDENISYSAPGNNKKFDQRSNCGSDKGSPGGFNNRTNKMNNFHPTFENPFKKNPIGMETKIDANMLASMDFSLKLVDDPEMCIPAPIATNEDIDFENALKSLAGLPPTSGGVIPPRQAPQAKPPLPLHKASAEVLNKSLDSNSSKKSWETPFNFPVGTFFSVVIQYNAKWEHTGCIWVSEQKHELPLTNLLRDINRNISFDTPAMPPNNIKIGSLVAAPFEELYYRAKVVDLMPAVHSATVRLIDYGDTFDVALNQVKPPIPIMRNLNAYAFSIRYSKLTKVGDLIEIRVLERSSNGVFMVEEREATSSVVADTLNLIFKEPEITIGHLFSSRRQFLTLFIDPKGIQMISDLDKILNSEETFKFDSNSPPKDGNFVAGRTSFGWQRTVILDRYDSRYLVYCVDLAMVDVLNQVKLIPPQFVSEPMQSLYMTVMKILCSDMFEELLNDEDAVLKIKPSANAKLENDSVKAILIYKNTECAEVLCSVWRGDFSEIKIAFWQGFLCPEDTVRISHVNSISEVYVALNNLNTMTKIFTEIGSKAAQCDKVNIDDMVLMKASDGKFYRSKVVEMIDQDLLNVHVIDYGFMSTVPLSDLYKGSLFSQGYPVYTTKVKLSCLDMVSTPIQNNKALSELKRHCENEQTFTLKFDKNSSNAVELYFNDNSLVSLNKHLLPLVFESATNEIGKEVPIKKEETKPMVSTKYEEKVPIPTPTKKMKLSDVEIIPIPTGNNIKVIVLDDSTVSEGYFTACSIDDTATLEKLEVEYTPKIQQYCSRMDIEQEYCPQVEEVCLAVFDEDGAWYRAFCVKQQNDEFSLMFLDYGNIIKQKKDKIREICKELMFPSNANACIIDGFPTSASDEILNIFKSKIVTNTAIAVAKISKIDDSYLVKLDV